MEEGKFAKSAAKAMQMQKPTAAAQYLSQLGDFYDIQVASLKAAEK